MRTLRLCLTAFKTRGETTMEWFLILTVGIPIAIYLVNQMQ